MYDNARSLTDPVRCLIRPGFPDFKDLPWGLPFHGWNGRCTRLEEVPRGLSRHPVVFVNYEGVVYGLKELASSEAETEYTNLLKMEDLRLPAVTPVGFVEVEVDHRMVGVVITCYLDRSLPYRSLFIQGGLSRYREHLLDAMAGLLVQLHLAGVYWGDCSLSNTLFRHDAGALQAFLVDAETAEIFQPRLEPTLRHHDLEIMEHNVEGDLHDLSASGELPEPLPMEEIGLYIRRRYQDLWQEITREVIISRDERYRIQERIRALNNLGFSVGEVNMQPAENGDKVRLRVLVTDRHFHRDLLLTLTGLSAGEMQARQMMNEIQEVKGLLSKRHNRSTPLSAAAFYWLEQIYQPTMKYLAPVLQPRPGEGQGPDPGEMYCQLLEHKWYLSERSQHDVGHLAAAEDFLKHFGSPNLA